MEGVFACINDPEHGEDVLRQNLQVLIEQYSDKLEYEEGVFQEEHCEYFINFALDGLQNSIWQDQDTVIDVLKVLKIVTRARLGLQRLCLPESITSLIDLAAEHIEEDGVNEVANQALRVVVNCAYVHQKTVLPMLEQISTHVKCFAMLKRVNHPVMRFTVCRLLMYSCLQKNAILQLLAEEDVYSVLLRIFHESSQGEFYEDADASRAVAESLKVLFLFHSDTPYEGDKTQLYERIVEIFSVPIIDEDHKIEDKYVPSSYRETKRNLYSVKVDFTNLMWTEKEEPPTYLSESEKVLDGFLELLEIHARDKQFLEGHLSPLLFVLKGISLTNSFARDYIKEYIFGPYADPSYTDDEEELTDEKSKKDKGMHPIGYKKDEPNTLKPILIKYITSFKMTLKSAASEFFYALAGNDSNEYIRLVGFGNAAGLLAEKGFGGLGGVTQNALDLDQLVRMKQEERRQQEEQSQDGDNE